MTHFRTNIYIKLFFFVVALADVVVLILLILTSSYLLTVTVTATVVLSHNVTNTLQDFSGRRIGLSQRLLITNNTHKRHPHTSMPPVGFKPAIPVSKRPQTHALDRAVSGICLVLCYDVKNSLLKFAQAF